MDAIDFFPFPSSIIQTIYTQKDNQKEERERFHNFKFLVHRIRVFIDKLKRGKAQFPKVIDLMVNLRKEREANNTVMN